MSSATGRTSQVCDHPAGVTPARPMGVKPLRLVGRAVGRERDLPDTLAGGAPGELGAEIQLLGPLDRASTDLENDLRTHFIACTTNADTTMYYNIRTRNCCTCGKLLERRLQDPRRSAPPSGVYQSPHPPAAVGEVDGHAICHAHRQENPSRPRRMAIALPHQRPRLRGGLMPPDRCAVDLATRHHPVEPRAHGLAERAPARQDVACRGLVAPLGERIVPGGAAGRDARNESEALAPAGELETGNAGVRAGGLRQDGPGRGCTGGTLHRRPPVRDAGLGRPPCAARRLRSARSPPPTRAGAPRYARNRARSARCCG